MAVIHLCNMLHEVEKKYKGKEKLTAASRTPRIKQTRNATTPVYDLTIQEAYVSNKAVERKKRKREQKKKRQKMLESADAAGAAGGLGIWEQTTVKAKPKKSQ
ncbi:unnamed protein product [Diatraea saccharalis]|uniref:Uncharacterized protein n=1 Tax=Diatraea saccharalis TaxID=40085 RepID=A0A9N9R6H4_9NEOP|nr:unnamed protein product [Diatraea saccharalis]